MSKSVVTQKGTNLPLMNLKGKDYLMVAYRVQWFNENAARFRVETDFLKLDDDQTIARAKVTEFGQDGVELKSCTATKRETKKDFPDHTEKAETGAIGRALALIGYGTQFAVSDLDEGDRLADSPLASPAKASKPAKEVPTVEATVEPAAPRKLSSFRKPKEAPVDVASAPAGSDEWT